MQTDRCIPHPRTTTPSLHATLSGPLIMNNNTVIRYLLTERTFVHIINMITLYIINFDERLSGEGAEGDRLENC